MERFYHLQKIFSRVKILPVVMSNARVAELVDAPDSGSGGRKFVEVRVLSRAPDI